MALLKKGDRVHLPWNDPEAPFFMGTSFVVKAIGRGGEFEETSSHGMRPVVLWEHGGWDFLESVVNEGEVVPPGQARPDEGNSS